MRILYVNPFAQKVSGADESLIGLLNSLAGTISPIVVLPPNSPQAERYADAGAKVVELPMQRIRRTKHPGALAAYAGLFGPETLRFMRIIRRQKIDLVHTNMEVVLQSGLAARLTGVPSIYHVRGTSFATPKVVCDVVVSAINKFADEIIVISRAVGEIFYERNVREKVTVIYNSLDPSRFDNPDTTALRELRDELTGGELNAPLVATVGRINPRKGLECFIEAASVVMRQYPLARFAIIGDAADELERAYLQRLRELAARVGVNGRLVIAPARRNIAELMSAIDVFVMTTLNEGFGRVAIEAMAARKPVVASHVGGLPEIVEEGLTGRLVPVNQPVKFAEAIGDLLAAPERAAQMGAEGRRRVESIFNTKAQAPAVFKLYERHLNCRGKDKMVLKTP